MFDKSFSAVAVAIAVVISVVGTGGIALAQGGEPDWIGDLFTSMDSMVDRYNANADDVDLGVAGSQLEGRHTNLYVSGPGGTATYSFFIDENLHLEQLSEDPRSDAKLKMTTNKATMDRIAAAENPAAAFRDAVENDEIVIAGEDGQVLEQVKWAILNFLKGFLF